MRYKDKKEIYYVFTIHKAKTIRVTKRGRNNSTSKLTLVNNFSKNVGNVDGNDILIKIYSLV